MLNRDICTNFGTTQKIISGLLPMYDEGKSGYWISETKIKKNPYFGSQSSIHFK
jgi:hypothetical protein